MTVRLYIRHKIEDFEAWRAAHAARAHERAALGVTAEGVHRGLDDPSDVTIWHDFADPDAARDFANRPEARMALESGASPGSPLVWLGGMT